MNRNNAVCIIAKGGDSLRIFVHFSKLIYTEAVLFAKVNCTDRVQHAFTLCGGNLLPNRTLCFLWYALEVQISCRMRCKQSAKHYENHPEFHDCNVFECAKRLNAIDSFVIKYVDKWRAGGRDT